MLGILLLYFIGKYFYQLAEDFNKNRWAFAILGIVTYYAGTFIFGLLIGILMAVSGNNSFFEMNDIVLSLIALPFGLLSTWALHATLKKSWRKQKIIAKDTTILDDF
jgi:high-affinity Fe2+/Pb2+ permease